MTDLPGKFFPCEFLVGYKSVWFLDLMLSVLQQYFLAADFHFFNLVNTL